MAFNFHKNWSITKPYLVGDTILHSGKQYVCATLNTGQEPPNVNFWRIITKWLDNTKAFAADVSIVAGTPVSVTAAGKIEPAATKDAIGVTVQDLEVGERGAVVVLGYIENSEWNWVEETPVLVDSATLTQDIPTTGSIQQIGIAVSPTAIIVNPQRTITLLNA